jgi:hypothetical protein
MSHIQTKCHLADIGCRGHRTTKMFGKNLKCDNHSEHREIERRYMKMMKQEQKNRESRCYKEEEPVYAEPCNEYIQTGSDEYIQEGSDEYRLTRMGSEREKRLSYQLGQMQLFLIQQEEEREEQREEQRWEERREEQRWEEQREEQRWEERREEQRWEERREEQRWEERREEQRWGEQRWKEQRNAEYEFEQRVQFERMKRFGHF